MFPKKLWLIEDRRKETSLVSYFYDLASSRSCTCYYYSGCVCVYERGRLTSRSLHDALGVGFVSSRDLSDGFVAGGHEDDGEEREDERGRAGDVP